MRIAFVSVSSALGGSETCLLSLVRGLKRARPSWSLDVIVPGEGPLSRRVAEEGAAVHVVPLPESVARLGESGANRKAAFALRLLRAAIDVPGYEQRLRRELDRLQPDIVHSNGLKAHVAVARAAGPKPAILWHVHEYIGDRQLTRRLMQRYASRCSAIVANSRSVAEDVRKALGGADAVTVIYNAVDLDIFTLEGASADLDVLAGADPAEPATLRVGLIATFGRWKGHDTFIEALSMLKARRIRGYVVGAPVYDTDGSQWSVDELKARAAHHGVDGRLHFTGFVDPVALVYRALDIVVHASTRPEPFGLVVAEAMACGRPVITSASGGAEELVANGLDALTHAPGDARSLATQIDRLAGDAGLRRRLGRAARDAAMERFALDRFTGEFIRTYERVVAVRGRTA